MELDFDDKLKKSGVYISGDWKEGAWKISAKISSKAQVLLEYLISQQGQANHHQHLKARTFKKANLNTDNKNNNEWDIWERMILGLYCEHYWELIFLYCKTT